MQALAPRPGQACWNQHKSAQHALYVLSLPQVADEKCHRSLVLTVTDTAEMCLGALLKSSSHDSNIK